MGGHGVPIASGAVHGTGVYTSQNSAFAMYVLCERFICKMLECLVFYRSCRGYIKDGRTQLLFVRVCVDPSRDKKIVGSGGAIEQLVTTNPHQLLPCYLVMYKAN